MSSHVVFEFKQDYHKGSEYGCVWRHAGGWGDTPCHYAMKGYSVSKSRDGMYNKDHRRLAREAGYVVDEVSLAATSKTSDLIKSEAEKRPENKRSEFMRRFQGKFYGALHYLKLHPEGWYYGHVIAEADLPDWARKRFRKRQPTFQVYDRNEQGYGAWYPYLHNYHHMVPQGALHEYVIANDDRSSRRLEIILSSNWNINDEGNVVLLPKEEFIAEIVQLPAHCPWGILAHPEYSVSMEAKLADVRAALDRAFDDNPPDCEEVSKKVRKELEKVSKDILRQIKSMQLGRRLGAVR